MRKKYLFLLAVLLLCVATTWCIHYINKPHTGVAGIEPSVTIDAVELYKQYEQNEKASDSLYLDKVIQIKGTVSEAQQSDSSINIILVGDATAGGINCSFLNPPGHATLPPKGSLVIIKGKCSGYLMDVNMVDCTLINN